MFFCIKPGNSRTTRVILGLLGGFFSDKIIELSHNKQGACKIWREKQSAVLSPL